MSQKQVQDKLAELRRELSQSALASETEQELNSFDSAVAKLSDTEASDNGAVLDQARALEARFAVEHPAAEQFMRYIVNTLARMGI